MSYRLEIGVAVLLAVALGVAIWAANRSSRTPDFDFRSSAFLSGPYGSKGVHEVLQRLGLPSDRRRTSLHNLATDRVRRPGILVVNAPTDPLEDDEVAQVVRFIRGGGAVVSAGWGGGITRCAGWRTQEIVGRDDSMDVTPQPGLRLPKTERVLTPLRVEEQPTTSLESLRKGSAEDNFGLGICNTLAPFAVDTVVAALSKRPVILNLHYRGGGTLTLAADRGWLTNRVWRDTDVPIVMLPLLTPRPERGPVVWDEYHQGFGEREGPSLAGSTWRWIRSSPAGWAILQLIAVALLWLAMTAVRFGPAREVVERRRRSPLEHLEALGAGLESAEDADTAVRRLAQGLRRRLSRAGLVRNENVADWLESLELAMRGPKGRSAVRRLHHLLIARDPGGESARVLQAAQAVEDVWEELRPRPRETRSGS